LRRSFRRALQWRFLLLWVVLVAVPAFVALCPVWRFLDEQLSHSPGAAQLVAALDSHVVADLLKALGDTAVENALIAGVLAAALATLLCMPFGAGAAIALARAEGPLRWRALLSGAGEHYGRMLRMLLVALLPGGLASALAIALSRAATKAAEHAVLESQALRYARAAALAGLLLLFIAQITVDAGRAAFVAQPHRRSAWLAWCSGVRLFAHRPWRSLLASGLPSAIGALVAAFALSLRVRVHQSGTGSLLLAFLLAELAVAAVGWHRAARLIALAELMRADAADREMLPRLSGQEPSVT
jgi:hypothetical protein